MQNLFASRVLLAISLVLEFSKPKKFIVEERPQKIVDPLTSKKIPRSHQRPKFTLIEPNKIRKKFSIPEARTKGKPTHTKAPHECRQHLRRKRIMLDQPCQGWNIPGNVIMIPAYWSGPTTGKVGNKIYKVRIDL